ncbi:MAG: integrin alpha [Rickettsiales bacterium]
MAAQTVNLAGLDGSDGFEFECSNPGDDCGHSIISFSSEGLAQDWLAVSAPGANSSTGEIYVMNLEQYDSIMSKENLNGANGYIIKGVDKGDLTGASLETYSNPLMNYDSLLIGTPNAESTGVVYEFRGRDYDHASSPREFLLEDIHDANGIRKYGFIFHGAEEGEGFGHSIAVANINNDIYYDVIIGAPSSPDGGKVYLFYGSDSLDDRYANALNGENGCVLVQSDASANFGFSISGYDPSVARYLDYLLVGSPASSEAYIIKANEFTQAKIDISDLPSEKVLKVSGNLGDNLGYSVLGVPDINLAAISAPFAEEGGKIYLYIHSESGFSNSDRAVIKAGRDGANLGEGMNFWFNKDNAYSSGGLAVSASGDRKIYSINTIDISRMTYPIPSEYNLNSKIERNNKNVIFTYSDEVFNCTPHSSGLVNVPEAFTTELKTNLFIGCKDNEGRGSALSFFSNYKPSPSPHPEDGDDDDSGESSLEPLAIAGIAFLSVIGCGCLVAMLRCCFGKGESDQISYATSSGSEVPSAVNHWRSRTWAQHHDSLDRWKASVERV